MLIERQLLLIRLATPDERDQIMARRYGRAFGAVLLACGKEEMIFELVGTVSWLDGFERFLTVFDVHECIRSEPQWVNFTERPNPASTAPDESPLQGQPA